MNEFFIDIKELADQDSASTVIDVFVQMALDQKGVKLAFANEFFQNCLNNLESPSVSPKTKFLTIYMLRQLSLRQNIVKKIFGPFSRHPLYTYIEKVALQTDPRKPVEEKGKNLFPGEKKIGNDYVRIILESLMIWGNRFGQNKDKPNRFTVTLENISDARIVMPKQFVYYQKKGDKIQTSSSTPGGPRREESKPQSGKTGTRGEVQTPAAGSQKVKEPKLKYAAEIKFMFDKIDNLLGVFEDVDDIDELQREINSHHLKFEKDYEKLQSNQEEMLNGQETDIIDLCFKLIAFFEEQKGLYNLHAKNNDYSTYTSGYNIAYEKIFEMSRQSVKPQPVKPQQPSIEAKVAANQKEENNKNKGKSNLPPSKSSMEKTELSKKDSEIDKRGSKVSKASDRENRFAEAEKVLDKIMAKYESRSRQPVELFSNVAKSLSKSKMRTSQVRKRNPMAVSNFNKSRFVGSSASRSTVNLKGIFLAPPNPHLRERNYEGEFVPESPQIYSISEGILRAQGHRRFKASHFKTNYILFEDDRIQIGFKSSQIYEKVDRFSSLLLYEFYFGNKTESAFTLMSLQFRGDKQSLVYTNPQTIEDSVYPGGQTKLEVLNVAKGLPFNHISMHLSFNYLGESQHLAAYLPNSILQMVSYYEIPASKYSSEWAECVKILKTDNFPLCPSFPPDQLRHFIPALSQNTSYSDFCRSGSTTDYELYAEVIIQESYEGILKINVRPDLSVVLQAGVYESEENCVKNFKVYLQGLQMVLRREGN